MHLRPNDYKVSDNHTPVRSQHQSLKFPLRSDLTTDLRNDLKSYLQTELYSDFDYDSLCLEFSRHFYGVPERKSSNVSKNKTYVSIRDLVGIKKSNRGHGNISLAKRGTSKTPNIRQSDLRFTQPVLDSLDLDSFFDRSPLLEKENFSTLSTKPSYDSLYNTTTGDSLVDLSTFLKRSSQPERRDVHSLRKKPSYGSLYSNRDVTILATVDEIYCKQPSCMDGFGDPAKFFSTWNQLREHTSRRHALNQDSKPHDYWQNLQSPRVSKKKIIEPPSNPVKKTEKILKGDCTPTESTRASRVDMIHEFNEILRRQAENARTTSKTSNGHPSQTQTQTQTRLHQSDRMSCHTVDEDRVLTRAASYITSDSMSLGEVSFVLDIDAAHAVNLEDNSEMTPLRQFIVENLVQTFFTTARNKVVAAGDTPYSVSNNSNLSLATTGTTGTTNTSLSTHSMSYRKRQSPDDDDEDESRRVHHRRLSDQIMSSPPTKLLACPYAKCNPIRYSERNNHEKNYRGCSSSFLRDVARVKQHLYRVHMRPSNYCFRCYTILSSSSELELHLRDASCPIVPICPFDEKMTVDQVTAIRRREMGKGAEGAWYDIYKILFPQAQPPLTPYAETEAPEVVDGFLEYFRREGPSRIASMAGPMLFGPEFTGDLQEFTSLVLENCIENVVRGYRESEGC